MSKGELRMLRLKVAKDTRQVTAALCLVEAGEESLLPLNTHIGEFIELKFDGAISCIHCGRATSRSFNSGYCYPCFTTLARCDLCVMSPDRCHYHLGTCREPEWGESFCMNSHIVYLANTSGLKVGITRLGREQGRWLDQGAVQALPVLSAKTRRDAGLAEAAIAQAVADKTDWRRMLRGEPLELDLKAARGRIRADTPDLPEGVRWLDDDEVRKFRYPVLEYPEQPKQLKPAQGKNRETLISGNLLGTKGQYLLLSSGVFNVRRFAGYHVGVSFSKAQETDPTDQMDLF